MEVIRTLLSVWIVRGGEREKKKVLSHRINAPSEIKYSVLVLFLATFTRKCTVHTLVMIYILQRNESGYYEALSTA